MDEPGIPSTINGEFRRRSPDELVESLIYLNYAHNRELAPHIAPESWAKIFPDGPALEARYQAELALRKANRP